MEVVDRAAEDGLLVVVVEESFDEGELLVEVVDRAAEDGLLVVVVEESVEEELLVAVVEGTEDGTLVEVGDTVVDGPLADVERRAVEEPLGKEPELTGRLAEVTKVVKGAAVAGDDAGLDASVPVAGPLLPGMVTT